MSRRDSPQARWRDEHRGKVAHRFRAGAEWHAWRLNLSWRLRDRRRATGLWRAYRCTWGRSWLAGETAPAHWHAGRRGALTAWREQAAGTVTPGLARASRRASREAIGRSRLARRLARAEEKGMAVFSVAVEGLPGPLAVAGCCGRHAAAVIASRRQAMVTATHILEHPAGGPPRYRQLTGEEMAAPCPRGMACQLREEEMAEDGLK